MESIITLTYEIVKELTFKPLLILPFLLFSIFIYKWLYNNNNNTTTNKILPPSPPKLPILGNLLQLGKFPHRSLHSLSKKYGDMFLLHLGNKPTLVVSSSNVAHEIMNTHDLVFANRPTSRIATRIIYDGKDLVFSPYGEYWRRIKSIFVMKLLSNTKVRSFRKIREDEVNLMVEEIRSSMSSPMNLSEILMTLSSNVLCRTAFGKKYSEKGGVNFKELLDGFVEVMGTLSVGDFVPWLGWVDVVSGLNKRVENIANKFDEFLEKVVQEHVASHSAKQDHVDGSEDQDKDNEKGFVDILLDVQRENKEALPNQDSIKALLLDMFAAGTESTYASLEWAMVELLRNPYIMKKLQEEVRGILKGKAMVDEDDLEDMKYLKAVIKEMFRLHPALPILLFKESCEDVVINGCNIAAKTRVMVNAWAIQRDPTQWKQPGIFHPERFLNTSIDFKGQNFQFIPFGAGRRGCPGISFSIVIIELVLANLVHVFDWKLANGNKDENYDMPERSGLTVRIRDPLLVIATPYVYN